MTYKVLEELKQKYNEGFRCIYVDKTKDSYTLHLKNFSTEKVELIETDNLYEISQIENYLQSMEIEIDNSGHDCNMS